MAGFLESFLVSIGKGQHLGPELGSRFVPYRFTRQSRDFLVDNAVYLVEKDLVELPIEPDTVRRSFTNVQEGEDGYEHASRKLKDIFDAVAVALSEVRSGRVGSPWSCFPPRPALHPVRRGLDGGLACGSAESTGEP